MKSHFQKIALSFAFFPFIMNFWYALTRATFDYGDAPTSYAEARAKDVEKVWLGDGVDKEKSAKRVDADNFDDGVDIDWSVANKGTAYFTVHKKVGIKGTAYLNLFVDFDKNGSWSANEWVVKNMAIDLTAQDKNETALYSAEFSAPAGSKDGVWYRAIVSYEQQATEENGGGTFQVGEVEDYIVAPPVASTVPPYKFFCSPAVLKLNHGEGGTIGVAGFGFLSLANSAIPENDDRTISVLPGGAQGTSIIYYKSTHVHQRDPQLEFESVPIRVDIQGAPGVKLLSRIKYCPVVIKHEPLEPMRPVVGGGDKTTPPKKTIPTGTPASKTTSGGTKTTIPTTPPGLQKFPSFDNHYQKTSSGDTTSFNVTVLPQDLAERTITGLTVVYASRNYQLPAPTSGGVGLNGGTYGGDWQCGVSGSEWRCFGKTPLEAGKPTVLSVYFNGLFDAPAYIIVGLLDSTGKSIGTVGTQLR